MRRFVLANSAWPMLTSAARERQRVTYQEVAEHLGLRAARPVRFALWPIQDLCLEKQLPPLTSIVINKSTRLPGSGFIAWTGDPAEAQGATFDFDWSKEPIPFGHHQRSEHPAVFELPLSPPTPSEFHVSDREVFKSGRGPYQQRFRRVLSKIYKGQCGLCDTRLRAMLVASHIIPWAVDRANRLNPRNGVLLCRTHDGLFEQGLIKIEPDYTVVVAVDKPKALGGDLLDFAQSRTLPRLRCHSPKYKPDPQFLRWRIDNQSVGTYWHNA